MGSRKRGTGSRKRGTGSRKRGTSSRNNIRISRNKIINNLQNISNVDCNKLEQIIFHQKTIGSGEFGETSLVCLDTNCQNMAVVKRTVLLSKKLPSHLTNDELDYFIESRKVYDNEISVLTYLTNAMKKGLIPYGIVPTYYGHFEC
jgi:hypothetical protein